MTKLKKFISLILALVIILPLFFVLASCGQGTVTLRILHWADYMEEDLLDEFERDYTTGGYKKPGQKIDIIFEAVANPEIMAVKIEKGKEPWDIMCPSETVLERLLKQNLLKPINMDNLENYKDYVSPAMKQRSIAVENSAKAAIERMLATGKEEYIELFKDFDKDERYSVGYMWGNFGILYNTEKMAGNEDLLQSWDALWNTDYKGDIMMKNSPRESFAIGIIYVYRNELKELYKIYEDSVAEGKINAEDDLKNYKDFLAEILCISNIHPDNKETVMVGEDLAEITLTPSDPNKLPKTYTVYKGLKLIAKVEDALKTQKETVSPFYETDDGKDLMVAERYAMDMAWNGDAVWARMESDAVVKQEEPVRENYLDYIIPKEGSNFWIDSWVIPKYSQNQEIAEMFLNFLCDPVSSARNMEYVGYTSVNSSEEVLKWAVLNSGNFDNPMDVSYFFCIEDPDNPEESLPMPEITLTDGDGRVIYKDSPGYEPFTVLAYEDNGDYYDIETDELLEGTFYEFKIDVKHAFVSDIQYPSQAEYDRCGVMLGYSDYNDEILEMWTRVKGASLPLYVIIGLSLIISGAIFLGIFFAVRKNIYNKKIKGVSKDQHHVKN